MNIFKHMVWMAALAAVLGLVPAVAAQDDDGPRDGSIRGTVYLDSNGNGQCATEGEPTVAGVPIEFVGNGEWTTYLQSGDNGTFGLVAAAYGTWQVSARPNAADYVVTSEETQEVFVGSENKVVLGVDFCVIPNDGSIVASQAGTSASPLMSVSGGTAGNGWFGLSAAVGMMMLAVGGMMHRRRENG